jgi:hypothetical protein
MENPITRDMVRRVSFLLAIAFGVMFAFLVTESPAGRFLLLCAVLGGLMYEQWGEIPVAFYVLTALAGTVGERLVMCAGKTWSYDQTSTVGLPVWLPILWALAPAVMIHSFNVSPFHRSIQMHGP